ncbi:hypothetical protein V8C44DRAFT_333642 [Trichoderma aethiopicum]
MRHVNRFPLRSVVDKRGNKLGLSRVGCSGLVEMAGGALCAFTCERMGSLSRCLSMTGMFIIIIMRFWCDGV